MLLCNYNDGINYISIDSLWSVFFLCCVFAEHTGRSYRSRSPHWSPVLCVYLACTYVIVVLPFKFNYGVHCAGKSTNKAVIERMYVCCDISILCQLNSLFLGHTHGCGFSSKFFSICV